jgi:hypothetical protein
MVVFIVIYAYKRIAHLRMLYKATTQRRSPQIPCSKCRFFTSNPRLKCAVHPEKVMTARAVNCSDQWLRTSDQFSYTIVPRA